MLTVADLHVSYGRVPAVRGVSLAVPKGELIGLLGPNGAGKSTTLLAIAGVVRSSRGAIAFEDHSLLGRPPERIVDLGIALVPQGRRIFGRLTVRENLLLGASSRRGRAEIANDLKELIERFPILGTYLDKGAGQLSGGEQQQLAIARALMARPRLLLLDEPSLGLAPRMVDVVFELLSDLVATGLSVLLVEQNAIRTRAIADKLCVMRGGEIALEGRRPVSLEDIERAYFGERERT